MDNNYSLNNEILKPLFAKYGKIYNPDEVIFREGDFPEDFYIIYNGKVKIEIQKENESNPNILNILGNGEIFGEMSLIDKQKRSASAISIIETKLIQLNEDIFFTLMGNQKSFILNVFKTLVNRVTRLSDIAAKLSQRDEKTRVFLSMANLIRLYINGKSNEIKISIIDLIKNISDDINLNQEQVAKYIDYLDNINKISIDKDYILINDVKKLLDFIGT